MTLLQVSKIYDGISKKNGRHGAGPIPLYVYIENFNKQKARFPHQTSQTCLPLQGLHSDQRTQLCIVL